MPNHSAAWWNNIKKTCKRLLYCPPLYPSHIEAGARSMCTHRPIFFGRCQIWPTSAKHRAIKKKNLLAIAEVVTIQIMVAAAGRAPPSFWGAETSRISNDHLRMLYRASCSISRCTADGRPIFAPRPMFGMGSVGHEP